MIGVGGARPAARRPTSRQTHTPPGSFRCPAVPCVTGRRPTTRVVFHDADDLVIVRGAQCGHLAGRVTVTRNRDGSEFDWPVLSKDLFRVASSSKQPDNAFVRVQYRGTWFYIEDSDLSSKSTFNLLDQLFQLQSGNPGNGAPMLTLPIN